MVFQNRKYSKKAQIIKKILRKNLDCKIPEFVEEKSWGEGSKLVSHLIEDELTDGEIEYLDDKLSDLDHLKDERSNNSMPLI